MEKSEAHSENLSPLLGYHLFSYGRMGDGEGPQAENSQKERSEAEKYDLRVVEGGRGRQILQCSGERTQKDLYGKVRCQQQVVMYRK